MTPTLWTRLRAALDPYTRRYLNKYAAYPLTRAEYVGTYDPPASDPVASARDWLRAQGYTAQRLSAAKRHPGTGALHVLSMRKVPVWHPFEILKPNIDAYGIQSYHPTQCQYHVHAFPSYTRSGLDLYSHYELRPWPLPILAARETPTVAIQRARAHYRPTWDTEDAATEEVTYLRGVTDLTFVE